VGDCAVRTKQSNNLTNLLCNDFCYIPHPMQICCTQIIVLVTLTRWLLFHIQNTLLYNAWVGMIILDPNFKAYLSMIMNFKRAKGNSPLVRILIPLLWLWVIFMYITFHGWNKKLVKKKANNKLNYQQTTLVQKTSIAWKNFKWLRKELIFIIIVFKISEAIS
jgi:hypothetical protein